MTTLFEKIKTAYEAHDIPAICQLMPYSQLIGMTCINMGREIVFLLPAKESNVGNPVLPAIHGGAIGGFMESSALVHILANIDVERVPKIVDFSIDYLRAARLQDTYAMCEVVRKGRKVVNVSVSAWQNHRHEPVARARAHMLL